jgi:hypothetical protein
MQLNVYSIENETLCVYIRRIQKLSKAEYSAEFTIKIKISLVVNRRSDGFLRPNQLKQKIALKCTFKILHLCSYVEYKFQDNLHSLEYIASFPHSSNY